MQVVVQNTAGEVVDHLDVSEAVFDLAPAPGAIHQALVRERADARLGTADTHTRGEVRGGGAKPYRQKGTGHARQGSKRAPHFKGGGVVFGPHPRSYHQDIPKKVRRLALGSALSSCLRQNRVIVLDRLELEEAKTREMAALLERLGVASSTLIINPEREERLWRSARNLPRVKVVTASDVSLGDVLSHQTLLFSAEALRRVEERLKADLGEMS